MTEVRLRFVGSGDAFGNGGRFQTCLLLGGGPERLMLDCGASSLTALKAGCRTERCRRGADHPLHGDHFHGEGKRDPRPGATSAGELHVVSREAERMASLIRAARWLSSSGATCRPGRRKWRANQSGEPV
jgi:hypothetical protein